MASLDTVFRLEPPVSKPVNVSSVPQRSLFRYPGGKTWFIPRLREWLKSQPQKPNRLVEPFAGGGIVSLTSAFESLVDSVLMVELDKDIAAVWQTILSGEGTWLADRILGFQMCLENVVDEIERQPQTVRERAFQTVIKNRTLHGGILAAGSGFVKKGEGGKGIASRWYPATLARRIKNMDLILAKLEFIHGDAFRVLEDHKNAVNEVFFIDPPYTAGGKNAGSRLYTHSQVDHEALFAACANLAGDFIMTYDNAREVRELATRFGFHAKPIAMKNTHHAEMTELVIGRDLSWMSGVSRVLEEDGGMGGLGGGQ